MTFTQSQIEQHNRLYTWGLWLIRSEIWIDGEPRSARPGWIARWRLRRGISLLSKALRINPSWQNHFWIGKALQRLGDNRKAITWFTEAMRLQPSEPSILREGANVALELQDYDYALALLRAAMEIRPDDATLHHNLGLAFLLAGRPHDAREPLEVALALQPHHGTATLLGICDEVLQGVRSCPRTLDDVRRGA